MHPSGGTNQSLPTFALHSTLAGCFQGGTQRNHPKQGEDFLPVAFQDETSSRRTMWRLGTAAVVAVCLAVAILTLWEVQVRQIGSREGGKLAVVVPVYSGDATRAMKALAKWPTVCSSKTLENTDLVIYWAESPRDVDKIPPVPQQASNCFRRTKIVSGNLLPEVCSTIRRVRHTFGKPVTEVVLQRASSTYE